MLEAFAEELPNMHASSFANTIIIIILIISVNPLRPIPGHFDPVEILFKQIAITLAYFSLR